MRRALKLLAKTLLGLLLLVVGGMTWVISRDFPRKPLPSPEAIRARLEGPGLCQSHGPGIRGYAALETVPPPVRSAFLAATEQGFYNRGPYKPAVELPLALIKAAFGYTRSRSGELYPALSQFLARCIDNNNDFCPQGSTAVCRITLLHRIERDFTKDLIFETYLNEIYLGREAYGVAAAAKRQFNKPMSELLIDEAALLTTFSRGHLSQSKRNVELFRERRNWIIGELAKNGTITPEEAAAAKARPLTLHEPPQPR
jgi:penicillin-binding protein 1A